MEFLAQLNENIIIIQNHNNAPLNDLGVIIHLNRKTIFKNILNRYQ